MTTSYYPQEEDWYDGDYFYEEEPYHEAPGRGPLPFDVIALAAVLLIVILLVAGLSRVELSTPAAPSVPVQRQDQTAEESIPAPAAPPVPGADTFVMPYSDYILTQGPHGMSYGHYALDLAAGNGEPVLSPINGRITELYVDGIGNPTLVIENEAYAVTMMHGIYDVQIGQEVQAGQQVGTESNQGNTRDMSGRSCRGRNCGYHTHLNVFSKIDGQNVNPLDLLPKSFTN